MKTQSGNFWLDLGGCASLMFTAWVCLAALGCALLRASRGEIGMFLAFGAVACFMAVRFSTALRSQIDHAIRVAEADRKIAELRRENKALETELGSAADR